MSMVLDPSTTFVVLFASATTAVVLLLWTYVLNRHESSLLWVAAGFLLTSTSIFLVALRETMPAWVSREAGVAVLLFGVALLWTAGRAFNGRQLRLWLPAAGAVAWLLACLIPGFVTDFGKRLVVSSLIIGFLYIMAAIEFGTVRDGLRTRTFAALILAFQAAFVLIRVPYVLFDSHPTTASFGQSSWFTFSSLEAAIFIQVLSFLMLSLTKERVEQRLRHAALTDPLTGLPNRRAFFETAEAMRAQACRHDAPFTIILFDLDRFKEINDRFGHPVGDSVLRKFATTARRHLRPGDIVARIGGEEFAAALPGVTVADAEPIARAINRALSEDIAAAMTAEPIAVSTAAGIAQAGEAGESIDRIMVAADRALYAAKDAGPGQVRICERAAATQAAAAPDMAARFRRPLAARPARP